MTIEERTTSPSEVWFSEAEDEIEPLVLAFEEPDEIDDDAAIDEADYAQVPPDFSDYQVWCDQIREWQPTIRFDPQGPWRCYHCDATDHFHQDHEGAGA